MLCRQLRPGDHFNPVLDVVGLEGPRDTPVELLHTYLLGQDKYLWRLATQPWDKTKEEIFSIQLASSSIDGLSVSSIRAEYLVKYKNSLVGNHFKLLQQVSVFHLYDGVCPPLVFDLWKATGELGALLWYHRIDNIERYMV